MSLTELKIKEAAGTTEYTYDGAGNRYTEKYTYSDSSKGYIFTQYNYNDQNRLTGTVKKLNGSLTIEKRIILMTIMVINYLKKLLLIVMIIQILICHTGQNYLYQNLQYQYQRYQNRQYMEHQ